MIAKHLIVAIAGFLGLVGLQGHANASIILTSISPTSITADSFGVQVFGGGVGGQTDVFSFAFRATVTSSSNIAFTISQNIMNPAQTASTLLSFATKSAPVTGGNSVNLTASSGIGADAVGNVPVGGNNVLIGSFTVTPIGLAAGASAAFTISLAGSTYTTFGNPNVVTPIDGTAGNTFSNSSTTITAVPEPSTLVLCAFAPFGFWVRKRFARMKK